MRLGNLTQAAYLTVLKKLHGDGYSQDEDSAFVSELSGIAKIASLVGESLDAAVNNAFVSSAVEALGKLEALLYFPSAVGYSDSQRQARLRAFTQTVPKMVEARLNWAAEKFLGVTTGSTVSISAADAFNDHAAPRDATLLVHRREPDADEQEARTLDVILSRGLPGRAIAGRVSVGDATYGASFERKSIATTPSVTPTAQSKSHVAPFDFYPGSLVDDAALREIQAMLCWKSVGFDLDQSGQGRTILAIGLIPNGATAVIDTSIDWSDRFIEVWGRYSSTDVRPGGVDEDIAAIATNGSWLPASKLGSSGSPNSHGLITIAAGAASNGIFSVNGSGQLTLHNTAGGTRYIVLFIRCTPKNNGGSSDTQPWAASSGMTNVLWSEIYKSTQVIPANGSSGWTPYDLSGMQLGAMRRIAYTGPLWKPSIAAGNRVFVTLDSTEDWRKRYLLVGMFSGAVESGFSPPAANFSGFTSFSTAGSIYSNGIRKLMYTGPGASSPSSSTSYTLNVDTNQGTYKEVVIYASSSDGSLMASFVDTAGDNVMACAMLMIIASEQIDDSLYGDVTSVPLHATKVHALDLNQAQNNGCFAQGMQGGAPRHYVGSMVTQAPVTCPPLGLISDSSRPRRPVSWLVRERIGLSDDGTYEVRQKLYGQRKRIVAVAVPTGGSGTPVDTFDDPTGIQMGSIDQMDFRDRAILVSGRFSSGADINAGNDSTGTPFSAVIFAGTFADIPLAINNAGTLLLKFEWSRKRTNGGYHSRLVIVNTTGSTQYVNLAIEASGFLGLADRRPIGDAT